MEAKETVSVCVVTWNSGNTIRRCLESIRRQTVSPVEILVVDNNSGDGTASIVEKEFPQVRLIRNPENLGFCRGQNQGFRASTGAYFLSLNPDVFLTPAFVEKNLQGFKKDTRVGMVCGKLLRFDLDGLGETEIIDSAGVLLQRNRRLVNRGEGEHDGESFQEECYVFAGCGAATLYLREMLLAVQYRGGELFDESFFAYKEDGDIGWRAGLLGWKCLYVPHAVAFHCRRWRKGGRSGVPRAEKYHSFKNRYLMLMKNERLGSLLRNAVPILGYEIGVLFYLTLREPFLWKSLLEVLRLAPEALRKRRQTMEKRSKADSYFHPEVDG